MEHYASCTVNTIIHMVIVKFLEGRKEGLHRKEGQKEYRTAQSYSFELEQDLGTGEYQTVIK